MGESVMIVGFTQWEFQMETWYKEMKTPIFLDDPVFTGREVMVLRPAWHRLPSFESVLLFSVSLWTKLISELSPNFS